MIPKLVQPQSFKTTSFLTRSAKVLVLALLVATALSNLGGWIRPAHGGGAITTPPWRADLNVMFGANLLPCQTDLTILGNNQPLFQRHFLQDEQWLPQDPIATVAARTSLELRVIDCDGSVFSSLNPNAFLMNFGDAWLFATGRPGNREVFGILLYVEPATSAPEHNPVVFIHGLGGKPEDWITGNKSMYWERLEQEGWPNNYRASYAYADYNHDGQYDYQGDIPGITQDLPTLVNQLAANYQADGGDCSNGCVDLVGFSLGGIVARQYLNEHPFSHRVRKLITIGSPHRGVFLLRVKSWLEEVQISPLHLGDSLIQLIEDFVNERRDSDQPLDLSEVVYDQLTPASDYLISLNSAVLPDLQKTELLYGDIQGQLRTQLFFFDLTREVPIGDGLIQIESATGVPTQNKNVYGYEDERIFDIELTLTQEEYGFGYEANQPNIQEYRFWHENLIQQAEVVDKVFEVLQ